MRSESDAGQNSSSALAEDVFPKSPWRVTEVEALADYKLKVTFADGLTGKVDMSGLLNSPRAGVFAGLADPRQFAKVRVELGAVSWPGDLDLTPDAMHEAIQQHGVWSL
jgi:hypothetical protein